MATTYSYQKGKLGGSTGSIFPYFRTIGTNNPLDEEYTKYIPAGFLRCRGQILSADQYPELAAVLGVGSDCIYKKPNSILAERDGNGTGGTLQLPDLGSKYISAGTTSGEYASITLEQEGSTAIVYKSGISCTLSSSSPQIEFRLTGNFRLPQHNLTISGRWQISGITYTGNTPVAEGNILAHGHHGTFAQLRNGVIPRCGRQWQYERNNVICYNDDFILREQGGVKLVSAVHSANAQGSDTSTLHSHTGAGMRISSQSQSGEMLSTNIPASSVTTTVNLNVNNILKMDSIGPKFILCEYLIKY
jgi:hypothetical protein